jgi:hypothetical protein
MRCGAGQNDNGNDRGGVGPPASRFTQTEGRWDIKKLLRHSDFSVIGWEAIKEERVVAKASVGDEDKTIVSIVIHSSIGSVGSTSRPTPKENLFADFPGAR